jgi:hypothetical protein
MVADMNMVCDRQREANSFLPITLQLQLVPDLTVRMLLAAGNCE